MPSERPADLYISGDIEADGPIPGRYSMLSFGLCVAGRFDGNDFEPRDARDETFYAELRPISDQWDAQALTVARLDRERLLKTGRPPSEAMTDAARWVQKVARDDRAVFVGFPAAFDWMFLYWYFVAFADEGSPFDFSAVLDMKTMFQQKASVVTSAAGLKDLPPSLRSRHPHTHNALDDAIEQADVFARLFLWDATRTR
jgi:3' exoribonuclease, RNase T-like